MEKSIEELYRQAKRFNEGEIYQSREYSAIAKRQTELHKKMRVLFGPLIVPLLEEYNTAVADEMELECRYFFEQGYLLGQDTPETDKTDK